jgi:hypothetical protein
MIGEVRPKSGKISAKAYDSDPMNLCNCEECGKNV